jgi:hypothetical protein
MLCWFSNTFYLPLIFLLPFVGLFFGLKQKDFSLGLVIKRISVLLVIGAISFFIFYFLQSLLTDCKNDTAMISSILISIKPIFGLIIANLIISLKNRNSSDIVGSPLLGLGISAIIIVFAVILLLIQFQSIPWKHNMNIISYVIGSLLLL